MLQYNDGLRKRDVEAIIIVLHRDDVRDKNV